MIFYVVRDSNERYIHTIPAWDRRDFIHDLEIFLNKMSPEYNSALKLPLVVEFWNTSPPGLEEIRNLVSRPTSDITLRFQV